LVASAALIVLLNHPEVVGCQIGPRDMEVVASLSKAKEHGEVAPSYEFWLPLVGGCGLYYYDSPYRIKGHLGADFVKGGSGADAMYGGDGDDKAGGGPGNDTLYGGAGDEHLSGGEGEDEIHGGEGDDLDLDGDHGNDLLYGGPGDEKEVDGDHDNDRIFGGLGDDGGAPTSDNLKHHGLRGEGGENQVYGNEGADTLREKRPKTGSTLVSKSINTPATVAPIL
jgi:Ca2+-binding RTX toxin-like protein